MDADFTRAQDELRRVRSRDYGIALEESGDTSQQSPMFSRSVSNVASLAGAPARGRGSGPLRAEGIRSAQSIYGNRSVQRFLSALRPGSGLTPLQRRKVTIPVSDELAKAGVASLYQASDADSGIEHDTRSSGEGTGGGPTVVSAPAATPSSPQLVAPSSPQLVGRSSMLEEPTFLYSQPSVVPPVSQSQPSSPAPDTDLDLPRPHPAASGLELMSLTKRFEKETEQNPNYKDKTATGVTIKTKYLTDEQERRPYEVSVGEEGKLYQGGQLLETGSDTASAGFRAKGSAGGHLYTMSPTGQLYSADQVAEWEKGGMQGPSATVRKELGLFVASDPSAKAAEATPFHHSSFLAGGDVAGAGEMKVHEGRLSMISNASGHYRPGSRQVTQTLNQLKASGAPIDQARVHLMGDLNPQTGYDASKEVTAAVGEFMDAGGSRSELLKRHAVLGDLRKAFGIGLQDSGPFKGLDMPPPESDEIKEAQKGVLNSLSKRNGFNASFRTAKKQEAAGPQIEGQDPLLYSDYMRRATGREAKPKAKGSFSFSMPAPAPSIAPLPAFSEPASSPAYTGQSESTPSFPALVEDSSEELPPGYVQRPEDGTY